MAQPELITVPFASGASSSAVDTIPIVREQATPRGTPTWLAGFDEATWTPLPVGTPPRGQGFNGVFNRLSQHTAFLCGGGFYKWSRIYVEEVGGYEKGSILLSDDGKTLYRSEIDANTENFNTTPSSIGTSWIPIAGNLASENISGLIKIATQQQVNEGNLNDCAITPEKLKGQTTNVLGLSKSLLVSQNLLTESMFMYGQKSSDVSSQRSLNTIYPNMTARAKVVTIYSDINTTGSSRAFEVYIDSELMGRGDTAYGTDSTITMPVPPGSSIKVTATGLTLGVDLKWKEFI